MKKANIKTRNMPESVANANWLQRIGMAGFIFFLGKGLVWVVAVAWVAY